MRSSLAGMGAVVNQAGQNHGDRPPDYGPLPFKELAL
jgi:hypothetical protein